MSPLSSPARRLRGYGLHSGAATTLTVRPSRGATKLIVGSAQAPLVGLDVLRADAGVRVSLGPDLPAIDLIEHLAAAVAGLGLWQGAAIEIEGGEVPLLDGGARAITDALLSIALAPQPPPLRVAHPFSFSQGESSYTLTPANGTAVHVEIVFEHPMLRHQRAEWRGDAADFTQRIAPARTFGFERDAAALRARGRAAHVDLDAVVVFTEQGLLDGCTLATDDEPVRHKLLDLIGDLAIYGGPPRGDLRAFRPVHAATHAFARAALRAGALVLSPLEA